MFGCSNAFGAAIQKVLQRTPMTIHPPRGRTRVDLDADDAPEVVQSLPPPLQPQILSANQIIPLPCQVAGSGSAGTNHNAPKKPANQSAENNPQQTNESAENNPQQTNESAENLEQTNESAEKVPEQDDEPPAHEASEDTDKITDIPSEEACVAEQDRPTQMDIGEKSDNLMEMSTPVEEK
jgi:hypothetical protein